MNNVLNGETTGAASTLNQQQVTNFGPFILDPANVALSRNGCPIAITPKAFDLLHCLLRHHGNLVTKDQLFAEVWPRVVVSDAALNVSIREIRQALGDTSRNPEYIETVHRKGYRFIAGITQKGSDALRPGNQLKADQNNHQIMQLNDVNSLAMDPLNKRQVAGPSGKLVNQHQAELVGRQQAWRQLYAALSRTLDGRQQIVFITGNAGIGKTSLAEQFVAAQVQSAFWIGKGHCIEHHGSIEPYLPILEAISRLLQQDEEAIAAIMAKYAPSWLIQFPSISHLAENRGQPFVNSVSPGRMMREMTDFLEALSQIKPLLLFLDDLHWCDQSTTEFLSFIARRNQSVRLLILATVNPAASTGPEFQLCQLKRSLIVSGLGAQVYLQFLSVNDVADYLTSRYQHNDFFAGFAAAIHRLSNGNPLFIKNILVALQDSQKLQCIRGHWHLNINPADLEDFVPYSLKDLIISQIERLSSDLRSVLEAAAVAGQPNGVSGYFTLAEVASALALAPDAVEEVIEQLTRIGLFLKSAGIAELPDGSISREYEFTHSIYKNVVYDSSRLSLRVLRHKLIAKCLVKCYGKNAQQIANKLAIHFERGRDLLKASRYLCQAAVNASSLGGSREAVALLTKARKMLTRVSPGEARDHQELETLQLLAPAVIAAKGNAAPEIEEVYQRALELSAAVGTQIERFPALFGLRSFYLITGRLAKSRELARELLTLAESTNDSSMLLEAHVGLASVSFYQGNVVESFHHAMAGIELYDPLCHAGHALKYGLEPGVFCYARAGQTAWALGQSAKALQLANKGSDIATGARHPYSQVFALLNLALIYLYRCEGQQAISVAAKASKLAVQHDFTFLIAWGYHLNAWAFGLTGEVDQALRYIDKALKAPKPEASTTRSFLNLFLAESYWLLGDWEKGLGLLKQPVLVGAFAAEQLRLQAEFHWMESQAAVSSAQAVAVETAESLYRQSLQVSHEQGTIAYSLRSVLGLTRVLMAQQRYSEAYAELKGIYEHCNKGMDKADVDEAERLLELID